MYFNRNIDSVLENWAQEEDRKPLILRGARQTGKSSSVREFGKNFELFIELNLDRHADLSLLRSCNSPRELLEALLIRHNLRQFPEQTLLFIDEVQESGRAVSWLRYFHEDHPELAVVAAGSFLEVRLQGKGCSFPVGRVSFRTLRPFTFFEFLRALGREVLVENLWKNQREERAPANAVHQQALELLREYLIVGGMPEAVHRWVKDKSMVGVRRVHADLTQALAEDMHKYRGARDLAYLEAAHENLKHHYGLRFKYENFAPGFRSQLMKTALGKLEGAMLISRVWPSSSITLPIKTRPKSAPKLLPLDIGMACAQMGSSYDSLHRLPLDRILDGRLAEIFVGLQLLASRSDFQEALHFWVSESSKGNAELDYLASYRGTLTPVEVKAGSSGSLKSLHQFLWRSASRFGVRFHAGPYQDQSNTIHMPEGKLTYRLLSLPLYLAETLSQEAVDLALVK